MSSTKDKDTEFQDWILKSVEGSAEEGYTITGENGWSLGVPTCPIVPMPGMPARLYGRGIGYTVRGVDIDGHECFYRTAYEEEQRREDMVTENERKRRQEFELKRADYDRRCGQAMLIAETYGAKEDDPVLRTMERWHARRQDAAEALAEAVRHFIGRDDQSPLTGNDFAAAIERMADNLAAYDAARTAREGEGSGT